MASSRKSHAKLATNTRSTTRPETQKNDANSTKLGGVSCAYTRGKDQFPAHSCKPDTARGCPDMTRKRRKARVSRNITAKEARNICAAAEHAEQIGFPLNRHCTIDWELAGVVDPVAATGKFCKLAGDMLRRHGGFAYVWVQENGAVMGRHVHILLHVPRAASHVFSRAPTRWVRMCGGKRIKGVLMTDPVHASDTLHLGDPALTEVYRKNLRELVDYILKAADHEASKSLGLRHYPQLCTIEGKRTSTSQNIGATARAKSHQQMD